MAESAMTKLRKHQFIPLIDTSETVHTNEWNPNWQRIKKSTIFALNPNPQTVTQDYISDEFPIEEIEKYLPELPQEVALYEKDPIYDFMFKLFYNLPVGTAIQHPALICFGGSEKKAWQIKQTTLVLGELNTVDGKLSFTMKFGGNIDRGTYAISDAGVTTFTPEAAAAATE